MVEERPSMLYVQQATAGGQASQGEKITETPAKPTGWFKQDMEKGIRAAWTALCFIVFCGFSFFLGYYLKGWHFSAYYDAPGGGSYLGAKPMQQQISQAHMQVPGDDAATH
jgi:hypothetical protein